MAQLKTLLVIGGAALAIAALPAPAQACHSGCPGTTTTSSGSGGTDVPAPAAFGLFGAAALGLVARRRRARG
ncbi:MAG TPA: PEP-CTERM sorting domain-containing protein [Allosphingosinicella sp.]|jgi:MYXO-CTERM domain-containing protein